MRSDGLLRNHSVQKEEEGGKRRAESVRGLKRDSRENNQASKNQFLSVYIIWEFEILKIGERRRRETGKLSQWRKRGQRGETV